MNEVNDRNWDDICMEEEEQSKRDGQVRLLDATWGENARRKQD